MSMIKAGDFARILALLVKIAGDLEELWGLVKKQPKDVKVPDA